MEFFTKAQVVKLRSHHGKYLIADDDQESVRQSRNSSSRKSRWIVEVVDGNSEAIRLKSCHGGYLTATNAPFLLGMTGNKVLQTRPHSLKDFLIEWQPIREGSQVKLRAFGGTYLRANGGTPPWRNSVTHDNPYSSSTYSWILWDVEAAETSGNASFTSMASSLSSVSDDLHRSVPGSPASFISTTSSMQKKVMEFFTKDQVVKLRSHHGKYLIADDDQESVRQSRNSSSRKSRWIVEVVDGNSEAIRLKSCHGGYLTATNAPFLLGMTGNKVLQTRPHSLKDFLIEWQPIREGSQVKLRAFGGTYLRANGGTPPWRNSVTHDNPYSSSTYSWILWDVEAAETSGNASFTSMASSLSSVSDDLHGSVPGSPASFFSTTSSMQKSGMELFHNAKAVRLRSFHDKYLLADEDEESVTQDRNGSSKNARWTVEFGDVVIRLKSCYGKYLTASNSPFLLGMTGRKVLQTEPAGCPDSTVEWEPIREGNRVKLRTHSGKFLRANGGVPPWRNSVTHDVPHRTATQDWILWDIHVVEIVLHSPHPNAPPVIPSAPDYPFASSSPSTHSATSHSFGRQESSDSLGSPPRPPPPPPGYDVDTSFGRQESGDNYHYEDSSTPRAAGAQGRTIYYGIADDFGYVAEGLGGFCIQFNGNGVDELTQRIDEELGIGDIIVCSRNPLNGKLYPLLLQLPPNAQTMHVVVVQSSSKVAREFAKAGTLV